MDGFRSYLLHPGAELADHGPSDIARLLCLGQRREPRLCWSIDCKWGPEPMFCCFCCLSYRTRARDRSTIQRRPQDPALDGTQWQQQVKETKNPPREEYHVLETTLDKKWRDTEAGSLQNPESERGGNDRAWTREGTWRKPGISAERRTQSSAEEKYGRIIQT